MFQSVRQPFPHVLAVAYERSRQPLPQASNHTGNDTEWPSETCGKGCLSGQGQLVVHRLKLNMINLSTKFEVSILFIHYEDTKGNAKCRNWSGFGRLGVTQVHQQHDIR